MEKEALGNILAQEQAASRQAQARIAELEQAAGRTDETDATRIRVAELERQLAEARTASSEHRQQAARLEEASRTVEKLGATVAELTATNGKLRQQLAAGQSAAKASTTAPEASDARLRALAQERDRAVREAEQIEAQLQRTRETNRTLNTANRQLLTGNRRPGEAPALPPTGVAAAYEERLAALAAQLSLAQQDLDAEQKHSAELTIELAAGRSASTPAGEPRQTPAAETTRDRLELEQEHEELRRLAESYRQEITRLTQAARTADQQRLNTDRTDRQNAEALAAQLAQHRRDLETARAAQARQAEGFAVREREQAAIINRLRAENGTLAARLSQTQGTLDQIAASVRLSVAGAKPAPLPAAGQPRHHTVAEGDSLSKISLRYYGTAGRWQEIYLANAAVLQGSNVLRVGQQLRIP